MFIILDKKFHGIWELGWRNQITRLFWVILKSKFPRTLILKLLPNPVKRFFLTTVMNQLSDYFSCNLLFIPPYDFQTSGRKNKGNQNPKLKYVGQTNSPTKSIKECIGDWILLFVEKGTVRVRLHGPSKNVTQIFWELNKHTTWMQIEKTEIPEFCLVPNVYLVKNRGINYAGWKKGKLKREVKYL